MTAKLTLTIDDAIISSAKKYAQIQGRSLSDMVETYLKSISQEADTKEEISPKVLQLMGIIKLPQGFDYKKELGNALVDKYSK